MLGMLVTILVAVLIFGLIALLIDKAPVGSEFKPFAKYALLVIFVIWLIAYLLPMMGVRVPWR